ncbi:hypothetical protein ACKVEX_05575 [Rhodocyclaceae bacterium SMB388]
MKLAHMIAVGAAVLLGASLSAHASPVDETIATPGKRLVSTDEVAKSRPGSFDVYIDEPTGFAFVHTPNGWVFTRKVPDARTASADASAIR